MDLRVMEMIRDYNKTFDEKRLVGAFEFAEKYYKDTDASLDYPMSVLEILIPLRPDEDTIVAVILHDLYFLGFLNEDVIKKHFGATVFSILSPLKRLVELNYGENDRESQAEILRKMFLTMARDIRVILIWLAARLAKMEQIDDLPESGNKLRISKETMEIYVPIASRLGVYRIKTQLEDLAFKYLHPIEYHEISDALKNFDLMKRTVVNEIKVKIEEFLFSRSVKAKVSGRFKSIYSIYKKLQKKGGANLSDIYDIFAIRVVLPMRLDDEGDQMFDHLYSVLGLIHSEWKPLSNRFKDYIAVPKPNGYRSLHTVVVGLSPKAFDQPVEIQIRDEQMHSEAEYGVASHWIYKSAGSVEIERLDSQVRWIKGLSHVVELFSSESESDVLKQIDVDIFKDRIFVLTPRGEVKDLPSGSTPLDFAYAVHTDIGNHCVMGKVNGHMMTLDHELENGDVVEIVTRADAEPKLKWLSIVKSNFAKNRIRAWFANLNSEKNIREGRRLINLQLERLQKPLLDQNYSILKNYADQNLSLSKRETLLEEVGRGTKLASDVVRKIYPYEKNIEAKKIVSKAQPLADRIEDEKNLILEEQVLISGEDGLPIKIAACCGPGLTDSIIGYVTRGSRITVHKVGCRLLDNLDGERLIFAQWKGVKNSQENHYRVGINLTVVSRVGLIHDITSVISSMGINIVDVSIKRAGSGLYNDCFLLDLDSLDKFDLLLDKLEEIKGVVKVVREDQFK